MTVTYPQRVRGTWIGRKGIEGSGPAPEPGYRPLLIGEMASGVQTIFADAIAYIQRGVQLAGRAQKGS